MYNEEVLREIRQMRDNTYHMIQIIRGARNCQIKGSLGGLCL